MTIKTNTRLVLPYESLGIFSRDTFEQVIIDIITNSGLAITAVSKTSDATSYDRNTYSVYYKNLESDIYNLLPMTYFPYIQNCYLFFSYYNNYVIINIKIVIVKSLLK